MRNISRVLFLESVQPIYGKDIVGDTMRARQQIEYGLIGISVLTTLVLLCIGGAGVGWMLARTGPLARQEIARGGGYEAIGLHPNTAPVLDIPRSTSDLENQVSAVYEQASPGVVNITTRSFEYDFFLLPTPREGSGSGFFYDTNGHIVTNYHVVQNAEELRVTLSSGTTIAAKVVGSDPSNDLAVIKVAVDPREIHVVPVANHSNVRVGQFVVAIGNPFGLERTLTLGVVSSLGRVIESPNQRFIGEIIQTDAAINPGNSGGPLLNLAGEVIGVNSAIFSPSGASAGIGFAIPARTVQRVVPALIRDGRYPHPSLGIQTLELTKEWVEVLRQAGMNVPVERGLLVVRTLWNNGLRGGNRTVFITRRQQIAIGGDIILAVNDTPISSVRDLIVYLETQTRVGQTVKVKIIRDGNEQTVEVRLRELPQD